MQTFYEENKDFLTSERVSSKREISFRSRKTNEFRVHKWKSIIGKHVQNNSFAKVGLL